MARHVKVAAAQMGPNNEGTSREEIVERMLALLEQAVARGRRADRLSRDGADDVLPQAHPRRTSTSSSRPRCRPRRSSPLLRRARRGAHGRATWASARRPTGSYFNTALLTDETGRLCGTFRKIHLPGTKHARRLRPGLRALLLRPTATPATASSTPPAPRSASRSARTGAIPESYRASALQGAEIVLIGYNTPLSPLALDLNELVPARGRLRRTACFVVGIAKAGVEDGVELIGGSLHRRARWARCWPRPPPPATS